MLALLGAAGFGFLMGWQLYFLNRYRKEVTLLDLGSVVSVLAGAAILALFPAGTELFGAYGLGLFLGFFSYFVVLVLLVAHSDSFTADWFIDGRYIDSEKKLVIPTASRQRAMGNETEVRR